MTRVGPSVVIHTFVVFHSNTMCGLIIFSYFTSAVSIINDHEGCVCKVGVLFCFVVWKRTHSISKQLITDVESSSETGVVL